MRDCRKGRESRDVKAAPARTGKRLSRIERQFPRAGTWREFKRDRFFNSAPSAFKALISRRYTHPQFAPC
jgi:hypothetical protein